MTLHAFEDIEDAFAATKAFLLPVDAGRWLRLALIAFFVGGVGGSFPGGGNTTGYGDPSDGGVGTFPDLTGDLLLVIAAVVAAAVLLVLAFMFVGSVMEFVLYASLREEEVHVRRYFGRHWRRGLRLFGFRVVVGLVALLLVAGPLALGVLAAGGLQGLDGPAVVGLLLLALPLAFVVGVVFALVNGFTTVFVVPVMLLTDRGVLGAWRRFWTTLRREWKQYLAYVFVNLILSLVAGAVVGFVLLLVGFAVFVPFLGLGLVGLVAGNGSPVVLGLLAVVAVVLGLFVLFLAAVARVPVLTFLRYYALFVLGDTDEDLDLIPGRRRAVRGGDSRDDDPPGDADDPGSPGNSGGSDGSGGSDTPDAPGDPGPA